MEESVKAVTADFAMRDSTPHDILNIIYVIENVYADCDRILGEAQMSLTGYVPQTERIQQVFEDMGYLNSYVRCAYKRAYDNLDHPLFLGFSKKATETLSRINLGDLKTDNTFKMEEYYRVSTMYGERTYSKRIKKKLTMEDFLGLTSWDMQCMPALENVETLGIFADLFRLEYQRIASTEPEINECLEGFLVSGEYDHKAHHPVRDFVSAVADVTIILPLIESIIGYDFITGEDLTDFECGVKGVGALIDLATLGSGSLLTGLAEKGGWKLVAKAVMKEMAVDALASGTAYLTGEMMEELGLPPGASLILTAIVSGTVTYVAGEYIFKDAAGNVIEKCTGDELDRILKGEIDNITPEISAVKSSKIGELLEDGVDTLDDALKGGMDAVDDTLKGGVVPDFYVGPNGKVLPSQYKDWIGTNMQQELLNQADNPKLQNAIKQLYRENSFIGDGGTADIIRFEKETGLMLGKNGGSHVQKGIDMAKYLEDKILSQDLSSSDRALAMQLLEDLNDALGR